MSYYTEWDLYGKDAHGDTLTLQAQKHITDLLKKFTDDWYNPDDVWSSDMICGFITDCRSGYSNIVDTMVEISRKYSDAVFRLECHNLDDEWYQRILFQNGEKEELDGYLAFDEPIHIKYGLV